MKPIRVPRPGGSREPLEKAAAPDLWRHTLAQIPSVFGRIVYLAGLRDSNSGQYVHHGLIAVFGEEQAHQAMKGSHQDLFAEWLEFGLEAQRRDLEVYLGGLEAGQPKVLETWGRLEPYRNLPPDTASAPERELFLADIETLLMLMRREHGVSSPGPGA
jgi:hypothetical protein